MPWDSFHVVPSIRQATDVADRFEIQAISKSSGWSPTRWTMSGCSTCASLPSACAGEQFSGPLAPV